jgi:hypothetical protein
VADILLGNLNYYFSNLPSLFFGLLGNIFPCCLRFWAGNENLFNFHSLPEITGQHKNSKIVLFFSIRIFPECLKRLAIHEKFKPLSSALNYWAEYNFQNCLNFFPASGFFQSEKIWAVFFFNIFNLPKLIG